MIKLFNGVRIVVLESEIFSHVNLLLEEFISLRKLNGCEEVRKVFVNTDLLVCHSEAPFLEV